VYWVLAAIFLLIALTLPRWRFVGVTGTVVLVLMLGWGMLERLRDTDPADAAGRGSPAAPTAAVRPLPLTSLKAVNLRLTGSGAPFELRGHVTNLSSGMRLKSFSVQIERRDCYAEALDPSGCVTLWTGRQWVELALNPGQDREFSSSFWARGEVPRSRGQIRDEILIVAADGESAR
jgi:hypothetical protein